MAKLNKIHYGNPSVYNNNPNKKVQPIYGNDSLIIVGWLYTDCSALLKEPTETFVSLDYNNSVSPNEKINVLYESEDIGFVFFNATTYEQFIERYNAIENTL